MILTLRKSYVTVFLEKLQKNGTPPGGLEPPTFRLTAERASRLRHGGFDVWKAENSETVSAADFLNFV